MASCDPIESPSGRECDDSTKRCRARMAATISGTRGLLMILRRLARIGPCLELVQQLLDPILAGNRFVVLEQQFGGPLEPQPRSNLPAQKRRRAAKGARRVAAALVVTQRGVEHAGLLQIRRHL